MNRLERRIIILLVSLLSISLITHIVIIYLCHNKPQIEVIEQSKFCAKDNGVTAHIPLLYKGKIHGSVGVTYNIEYDSTAFSVTKEVKYNNPKGMSERQCGADGGIVIYTLHPLIEGEFIIYEVEGFRGEEKRRIKHEIFIKEL